MAERDPRIASHWVIQPSGLQNPLPTNGDLLSQHRASPGGASDSRSDDHPEQVAGRGASFRGSILPQPPLPPPPLQYQIQPGSSHGTPTADATAVKCKADGGSVAGLMMEAPAAPSTAPSTAPSATASSSATASFVTSAVKGGWSIGDPGTELGGAPGASVTVVPIPLTPQGNKHGRRCIRQPELICNSVAPLES